MGTKLKGLAPVGVAALALALLGAVQPHLDIDDCRPDRTPGLRGACKRTTSFVGDHPAAVGSAALSLIALAQFLPVRARKPKDAA